MQRRTCFVALVGLLALSPGLGAAKPPQAKPAADVAKTGAKPDPMAPGLDGVQRLAALIDRVKLEQKGLKTLQAQFVQHQQSELLVAPEESSGTFSFAAPDKVRWEYKAPNPISVVIAGDEMTTWYRDLKRADKLKVGRYSSQVFKYLGASGSMQSLIDYFRVALKLPGTAGEAYRLELTPKYARIAKRLKGMTLWIDAKSFVPVHLKYTEADGDTTEYEFKDVQVNAPLPGDRFVLTLPPGVETRVIDLDRGKSSSDKTGKKPAGATP